MATWVNLVDFYRFCIKCLYMCKGSSIYMAKKSTLVLAGTYTGFKPRGGEIKYKKQKQFSRRAPPPPPGVFFIPSKLLLLYLRSQCPIYNDTLAWNLNLITDVEDVPSIFLLGKCVFLIISLFPLFGNAHVTLAEKLNSYKETKAWISKSNSKQNLS